MISGDLCSVCLDEKNDWDTTLVQCEDCQGWAHPICASIPKKEYDGLEETKWRCKGCISGLKGCSLCSHQKLNAVRDVSSKITGERRAFHLCCAISCIELDFNVARQEFHPEAKLDSERKDLECCYCKHTGGAVVQCCVSGCNAAASNFHAVCAHMKKSCKENTSLICYKEITVSGNMFINCIPVIYCEKHACQQRNLNSDLERLLAQSESGRGKGILGGSAISSVKLPPLQPSTSPSSPPPPPPPISSKRPAENSLASIDARLNASGRSIKAPASTNATLPNMQSAMWQAQVAVVNETERMRVLLSDANRKLTEQKQAVSFAEMLRKTSEQKHVAELKAVCDLKDREIKRLSDQLAATTASVVIGRMKANEAILERTIERLGKREIDLQIEISSLRKELVDASAKQAN